MPTLSLTSVQPSTRPGTCPSLPHSASAFTMSSSSVSMPCHNTPATVADCTCRRSEMLHTCVNLRQQYLCLWMHHKATANLTTLARRSCNTVYSNLSDSNLPAERFIKTAAATHKELWFRHTLLALQHAMLMELVGATLVTAQDSFTAIPT